MVLLMLAVVLVMSPAIAGLALAAVPTILNRLCRPQNPVRRTLIGAYVGAYVVTGVWVTHLLGSGYTRAVAGVDPDGDCNFGASGGCKPTDLRPVWIFFWCVAGFIAYRVARRSVGSDGPRGPGQATASAGESSSNCVR
jgi:hypothetical protein